MSKAFLAHSSTDKTLVGKIAQQLGRNNCHYDEFTFEGGNKTLDEIIKGLEKTDVFVLFISEKALESEWVRDEISAAKKMLDKNVIERIFPLIIDKNIHYSDHRIPEWIKKPYNLKYFDNEVLIFKKIKQFLRESNFKKFSHLKEINELFVGRHELMQDFERKLVTIDNSKPTCITAYSYFEGIGRRTFLRNALIKTNIIDKWYEPIYIPINSKESIEDFIYKLNFIDNSPDIYKYDFAKEEMGIKISLAQKLIKKFVDNNELVFIVDEGTIILPNKQFTDWFQKILEHPSLKNQISLCLISKYRPDGRLVRRLENVLAFQVDELSRIDTQTLFIQYLRLIKCHITTEDIQFFLKYLHGIPGQVLYAANLIESLGVNEAKKYVQDIEEFDELRVLSVLDFIKDDKLCKDILIALSRFEVISYDLAYRIFGESEDIYRAIQKLYDLGLFYPVSPAHEYLKLNTSIADYINRARLPLSAEYSQNLKDLIEKELGNELKLNENSDYSMFLISLQEMIKRGIPIPSKYFIPSFILKTIIKEYNERNFKTVIPLANKLLENSTKFDPQIIRETIIYLCLAYCRTRNEKIFDEISYFKEQEDLVQYYFLLGFYYRNIDRMDDAARNYLEVLKIDPEHSRSKRELVNVFLRRGEYSNALNLAEDNYNKYRSNILHIQAYFTCLIKKDELTPDDIETIDELLERAKKSLDKKGDEIYREMQAEYDYYLENNITKAVSSLEEALKVNANKYFVFRALCEIYRRCNMDTELSNLEMRYPQLLNSNMDY